MKAGSKPNTASTEDRETLVGMVEMCFSPDGSLAERYRRDLLGWLGAAKMEGHDPEAIYSEALQNLRDPSKAPAFEEVAPH